MTNPLLDQTTDISESIAKQTAVAQPDMVNQNPTDYVGNISKQAGAYIGNYFAPQEVPDRLYQSDIFPTRTQPVTQQGVSGKFLSMPTIAPTGALIPFGMMQEQERRKAKEEKEQVKNNQINHTIRTMWNPKADVDYVKGYFNGYNRIKAKNEQVYGKGNAIAAMKNDDEWVEFKRTYDQIGAISNDVAAKAAKILAYTKADDPYVPKGSRQLAKQMFGYYDNFIKAETNEDLKKWGDKLTQVNEQLETSINISESLKNAKEYLKGSEDSFDTLLANPKDINGKPIGTADEKGVLTETFKSAFIKPIYNDGGDIVRYDFDEESARDHFAMIYNSNYPQTPIEKKDDGTYGFVDEDDEMFGWFPPEDYIQLGVNGLAQERKSKLDKFNTNALGYRKLAFDKKQAKSRFAVPVVAPLKDRDGNYVSQDFGGGLTLSRIFDIPQNYYYDDKGNKRSVSAISGVTLDATDADGNPIKISAEEELTPVKTGTAKDKQVIIANRWNPNTGITDEVRFNYNTIPAYMDKVASFTGINSDKFEVDPENQFIAYPKGGDYTQTGISSTGKQIKGETTTFNEPSGKYNIKGKEYTLDELKSMGYTEEQVSKYKAQ